MFSILSLDDHRLGFESRVAYDPHVHLSKSNRHKIIDALVCNEHAVSPLQPFSRTVTVSAVSFQIPNCDWLKDWLYAVPMHCVAIKLTICRHW